MDVITSPAIMRRTAEEWRRDNASLGLVPTMGYFHEGHLSLMRRARADCRWVVVSLFVNPTQFGPGEDLARYPRNFERDRELAAGTGADALFAPEARAMYPEEYATYVDVERLTDRLCGASRPGHFRGVATVVAKLFNCCRPTRAYFGRKDYQQAQVIKRLVADLNFDIQIDLLPTVREADGLAMSSRNEYLTPAGRRQAACLYRALARAQEMFTDGVRDPARYVAEMKEIVAAEPDARLDYAEVVHPAELTPATEVEAGAIATLAVYINGTRLIDNTALGEEDLKAGVN